VKSPRLKPSDLQDVFEMYVLAIAATMPDSLNFKIAARLDELGRGAQTNSPNVGAKLMDLAELLRNPMQQERH